MKSQWEGNLVRGLVGSFDSRSGEESARVTWIESTAPALIVC